MKISKTWLHRGISILTTVVVGTGAIIGNVIALQNQNNIDQILCPPIVDMETLQKTQEKAERGFARYHVTHSDI